MGSLVAGDNRLSRVMNKLAPYPWQVCPSRYAPGRQKRAADAGQEVARKGGDGRGILWQSEAAKRIARCW
jgi:hypothetical protein